jgi:transcriptional regulator with XRE-family HTH domain
LIIILNEFIICKHIDYSGEVLGINNLKYLRKTRKVKTSDITEFLGGISSPFYYDLENGERTLSEKYLVKLSDFYNVTVDYLIGRVKNEQGYILEGDLLPKELREIDVEAVELIKDAKNSGVTLEDIREIIEYKKFQKRKT